MMINGREVRKPIEENMNHISAKREKATKRGRGEGRREVKGRGRYREGGG